MLGLSLRARRPGTLPALWWVKRRRKEMNLVMRMVKVVMVGVGSGSPIINYIYYSMWRVGRKGGDQPFCSIM